MKSKINWYKELSLNMLKVLKKDEYDKFNLLADERQAIINILVKNNEVDYFRNLYNKHNVDDIDKEMRNLLEIKIQETKLEIREHKLKIKGNSSYNNIKKENLNIFLKKV